ncbi:MAG: response regulator [Pseudomonadota bacterium]
MRCLIVEDHQDLAELLGTIATDLGLLPDVVYSQSAALDRLQIGGYDVVLSDLHLPDGNGLTVVQIAAFRCPEAKAVLLTGSCDYPFGEMHAMSHNICTVLRKQSGMAMVEAYLATLCHRAQHASAFC